MTKFTKKHFNFNVKSEEPLKNSKTQPPVLFGLDLNDQAKKSLHLVRPVFRIHDILVWIRIRIRGSMPLTMDPDPYPAIFVTDLQDANKKLI